jgi:hypothetical protein
METVKNVTESSSATDTITFDQNDFNEQQQQQHSSILSS